MPGRPTIRITVGQGPTALAVGADGVCLDIFSLAYPFSPLSPALWETARYRMKNCLKGSFNPKQPTNQRLGGAKVLGKLSVPGRPTYLNSSRARAYCACSRCGWGCLTFGDNYHNNWLVGCFGFNGPFRQNFSLYRAVSQREGEREEKR